VRYGDNVSGRVLLAPTLDSEYHTTIILCAGRKVEKMRETRAPDGNP
jgi:hypothetical protein